MPSARGAGARLSAAQPSDEARAARGGEGVRRAAARAGEEGLLEHGQDPPRPDPLLGVPPLHPLVRLEGHGPRGSRFVDVVLVLDILLQEPLDDVLERNDPGHVYVRRNRGVALPGLLDVLGPVGDQRQVAPAVLELVEQVQHGDARGYDHQRLEAQGLHASALAALVLRGHHDQLLHQDEAAQVVLVHRVHGHAGVAAGEDLLQQPLRQALGPLQHPGLAEGHHRLVRRHVREEHDAVHDLELVALLHGERPRHDVVPVESDEVVGVPAFASVQLDGAPLVPPLQRGTRLHVVGDVALELRGLPRESHDGHVAEVVLRVRRDDAEALVVVALEVHRPRLVAVQPGMDAHDGAQLRKVVAPLVVLAQE
mmetsp:Transcript_67970/g.210240  ORF Transcript_67970/g.210240 Transcript_67970/m.210240 type:complete len:368 (+) Transcript_67970:3-1106(+)